ncbi:hypothetical protein ILUMI_22433 [Ignelater luminosus]|uniref:Uncharacterized protein n=1 Tax=Ignelater luminosus TaxID=2038154 RepID=A0A8K0CCT6_IGNLU|nr:hypothetical protein ILUMI_22433 [Ignelater luminosus]
MTDRWLKTGSIVKSDENLDKQSIASSTTIPNLKPTPGGNIESCSELPSRQTGSNDKIGEKDSKMALDASFRVSYRIARSGQAHIVAENLIGPCAKDIPKCMLGEKAAKKIDLVSLSNNTVSRRINDLANNVESELLNYFAVQLDESPIRHYFKLNDFNLALQGPGVTIFNVYDRIEAMLKKFNFWIQCLQMNEYECLDSLNTILSENEIQLIENIKRDITEHLQQLQLTFKDYFPNKPIISGSNNWIHNPFQGDITSDSSLT